MRLELNGVSASLGGRRVLNGVGLTFEGKKRFYGVIGPNGSGKSTLLRLMYGALQPESGSLSLDGVSLPKIRPRDLAKKIAVVPQTHRGSDLTVEEMLEMGRYPYKGLFEGLNAAERRLVGSVMETLDLSGLRDRTVNTLSGGERQMTVLGRAMVQETEAILLDEPTNHLDIRHQVMILDLLKKIDKLIVVVFHDLNLAAKYCERIVLLGRGSVFMTGSPEEIVTRENIMDVYGQAVDVIPHPATSKPVVLV